MVETGRESPVLSRYPVRRRGFGDCPASSLLERGNDTRPSASPTRPPAVLQSSTGFTNKQDSPNNTTRAPSQLIRP